MKNKNLYFVALQILYAFGILFHHYSKVNDPISFIIAILTGLLIIFNIIYGMSLWKDKSNYFD
jgi:hypothetical protein